MEYAELFLRGIGNKKDIDEEGYVLSNVFQFTDKRNVSEREDGYQEESIFWKDDVEAVELLLNQKKDDGSIQFKGGAAVVERQDIERIGKSAKGKNQFSYERKALPGNPYHGNLLLIKTASPSLKKQIASTLALLCKEIIPQKE